MGLADDLAALEKAPRATGGVPCRVSIVLAGLDATTAAVLRRLIDETDVWASTIARKLMEAGHEVSSSQIGHHRRRLRGAGCRCPRPEEET